MLAPTRKMNHGTTAAAANTYARSIQSYFAFRISELRHTWPKISFASSASSSAVNLWTYSVPLSAAIGRKYLTLPSALDAPSDRQTPNLTPEARQQMTPERQGTR